MRSVRSKRQIRRWRTLNKAVILWNSKVSGRNMNPRTGGSAQLPPVQLASEPMDTDTVELPPLAAGSLTYVVGADSHVDDSSGIRNTVIPSTSGTGDIGASAPRDCDASCSYTHNDNAGADTHDPSPSSQNNNNNNPQSNNSNDGDNGDDVSEGSKTGGDNLVSSTCDCASPRRSRSQSGSRSRSPSASGESNPRDNTISSSDKCDNKDSGTTSGGGDTTDLPCCSSTLHNTTETEEARSDTKALSCTSQSNSSTANSSTRGDSSSNVGSVANSSSCLRLNLSLSDSFKELVSIDVKKSNGFTNISIALACTESTTSCDTV